MSDRIATTYAESLQGLASRFREGQKWPATAREIALWSYRNGLWKPQEKDIVGQLTRDISRALREECYTDPQGRRVRTKHAARRVDDDLAGASENTPTTQKVFWHDIRTDNADHIIKALQQRRMQIVGACKQLKTDGDSFNDNHPSGKTIQQVFDFGNDLADREHPTEYMPPAPSPDDHD